MSTQQFHFFIGPVHEFVASARRTRDFKAGSVLLSWLTSVAAYTAQKCAPQANDLFPPLEADLIKALEQGQAAPTSMPNRFSISVDETFDPQTVEKAVRNAWRALAA
ncbi:type III-B CRISPR-associated protein Cas10/Cmr2, partial [Candidatus Parcubacteria bacterium]